MSISHFALSSVLNSPEVVEEISNTLRLDDDGAWFGGQTCIETGSPRLSKENMFGKCKPSNPKDWPDVIVNSFEILSENHWRALDIVRLLCGVFCEIAHLQKLVSLVKLVYLS